MSESQIERLLKALDKIARELAVVASRIDDISRKVGR